MIRSEKGEKKIDWYIKWVASIIVILAIISRASGPEFRTLDLYLSLIGVGLWTWVSILWEDRALILLNGVSVAIIATGIMREYGEWWLTFWKNLL